MRDEPQPPRFLILIERRVADDFRQFSRSQAAERVHLPHSILGRDVALQENRVLPGCRGDVRHT